MKFYSYRNDQSISYPSLESPTLGHTFDYLTLSAAQCRKILRCLEDDPHLPDQKKDRLLDAFMNVLAQGNPPPHVETIEK